MKQQHFIPQVIGISLLLFLGLEGLVKAGPFDATPDGSQSNQRDSFNSGLGNGLNPIDLIHRATLTPGRKPEDFSTDSQQNIQNAAEKYKKQQMQQVKEPNPTGITAPSVTP